MAETGLIIQPETSLVDEKKFVHEGTFKDDSPLDLSEDFNILCEACRRGDLRKCQEKISEGVNINARDSFDYTPLILERVIRRVRSINQSSNRYLKASLCGHFEVVQLLLDSGALCERDTFQGERCLYNALNKRIHNLLLEYDYSKSTDPLQPFAAHISSLLTREHPKTADFVVINYAEPIHLHKFILAARSPLFQRLLTDRPTLTSWSPTGAAPPPALGATIKHLYLGEAHRELKVGSGVGYTESEIAAGVHEIARQLEIPLDSISDGWERRVAKQRRAAEVARGRLQLELWFRESVLGSKVVVKTTEVNDVKWDRNNAVFADVLLRADDVVEDMRGNQRDNLQSKANNSLDSSLLNPNSLSRGSRGAQAQKSTLFPAHRAMLLRSGFFNAMFSSSFREAQATDRLKIIHVDCSPAVLEIVLTFLYTEKAEFPLEVAVDVLFAADLLFIDKLKTKAAVVISSLGSGNLLQAKASKIRPSRSFSDGRDGVSNGIEEGNAEEIDIYDIIRASWLTRVQRLEEFGARYLAYRLEAHIDSPEFGELIQESAARISERQQTDSIELLDDIRFYLSERFRLRFDDTGLVDLLTGNAPKREANANETKIATDSTEATGRPALADNGGADVERTIAAEASSASSQLQDHGPAIRTLGDEVASDEFASDAINYQLLMEKLDKLLERLDLEA
ncbi:hypothetical protein V8E54_014749 [Elaphomyces granulatus]